ncbi:MAG: Gfo/Idh/MocA family oxidoreductase, partial [Gemmobacter sp.]|nr:Gfo/Idh/MocA family oxidoreductase [Gemmobacter sp.]
MPAFQTAKGAELVALGTSDPVKAAPFLAVVPGLQGMGYEDLLADPSVDAVYIPLPNHLHVDWTIRVLRAGKHVLCERPLALAASDIDRVIAVRDATGLLAAEGFKVAHHPQWARDLLAEGAIGLLGH